jgi:transposase-like protein
MEIRSRHRKAIEILASGARIEECAQAVGVTRQSIYSWLADAEFSKRLRRRESEEIKRLNARYIMASEKALEVLLDGLESRDESIRIRSASIIKSSLLKSIEVHDVYDLIEKLSEKVDRLSLRKR